MLSLYFLFNFSFLTACCMCLLVQHCYFGFLLHGLTCQTVLCFPVRVKPYYMWVQLYCLLSRELFLFLWINKLVPLPLRSCLFVSMVHLHVSSGNAADGHRVLFWVGRQLHSLHPVAGSFPSFLPSAFHWRFMLMLCLVVMAGFKVGGGEAVLA